MNPYRIQIGLQMTLENALKIKELLQELVPDPTIDFGPAYEGTKQRQKEAIQILNAEIRWMKALRKKA
jgi:hypothetical protein